MHIIDSHFHWWPRAFLEHLSKRQTYPRTEPNGKGGFHYFRRPGEESRFNTGLEWIELDQQFAYMDSLGHDIDVVCSIGPISVHFSDVSPEQGREDAMVWNEQMAWAQKKYAGRLWASAAVPLTDTKIALEVVDHAVNKLGLMGVNLPGSVGGDPYIDSDRLEPFYARCEELGLPLFLHPTDAIFPDHLQGYDGALHLSLGRVIEVSVAAMRLVLSGMIERHPGLKIVMSHTGGALPYQSGRMDKNTKKANLPRPASEYMKRMYTDTVSPHSACIKFAIEYYGVHHVMYGTDYPCLDHHKTLDLFDEIALPEEDRKKILYGNVRKLFNLRDPVAQPMAKVG